MAISSLTLASRFGYGVRPGMTEPSSVDDVLAALMQQDPLTTRFQRPDIQARIDLHREAGAARKDQRNNIAGAEARYQAARKMSRTWIAEDIRGYVARAVISDNGFRERLVAFWSDHFTVSGKNQRIMLSLGAYINEAIRPNTSGNFADMLKAVVGHPAMLMYLDQVRSIGPNSEIGLRQDKGLNENLAREILELHTLGVDGSYSQNDVRQFAELLTGIRLGKNGVFYEPRAAEPGAESILGNTYGGDTADVQDIYAFLDALAVHPDTAKHIARKLAVHFVSDTPSDDLVNTIADAYRDSGGALMPVYRAMLSHVDSATPNREKVKWPVEYMISSMRALNLGETLVAAPIKELKRALIAPLQSMGQDLFHPLGPDGWSEAAADWITPPTLTARIEWASGIAKDYGQDTDPRALLLEVVGENASQALEVAVAGAESKWEGVALLLVSPEFNRR